MRTRLFEISANPLFLISFLLLPFFGNIGVSYGQEFKQITLTPEQRQNLLNKTQYLFEKYVKLQEYFNPAQDTFRANEFTRLFMTGARLYDDFCPTVGGKNYKEQFLFRKEHKMEQKTPQEFIEDIKQIFPNNGVRSVISNANFSFNREKYEGIYEVIYEKRAYSQANDFEINLESKDTLIMQFRFTDNNSNVQISDIRRYDQKRTNISWGFNKSQKSRASQNDFFTLTYKPSRAIEFWICPNDDDCDGTLNQDDSCRTVEGYDESGCPIKGTLFGFTPSAAFHFAGTNNTGSISTGGYNNVRNESITKPTPGNIASFFAIRVGMEIDAWKGRRYKNYGVAIGAFYYGVSNQYSNSNYQLSYTANEGSGNYNQDIQIIDIKERVFIHSLAISGFLKYSGAKLSKSRFNYYFQLGGFIIPISVGSFSVTAGTGTYEARYKLDGNKNDAKSSDPTTVSPTDWIITQNEVNKHGASKAYFEQLQAAGYNVGLNQKIENTTKSTFITGFGFGIVLRAGVLRRSNRRESILLGGELLYGFNGLAGNGNYTMSKNANGKDYESMLSAMSGLQTFSIGATIAYQKKLFSRLKEKK